MDLADGGDGSRCPLQSRQERLGPTSEIFTEDGFHALPGRGRGLRLQEAQERACLLGQVHLEVAHDLAELHGESLERAQTGDQLLHAEEILVRGLCVLVLRGLGDAAGQAQASAEEPREPTEAVAGTFVRFCAQLVRELGNAIIGMVGHRESLLKQGW
jgi:hypothetical protein